MSLDTPVVFLIFNRAEMTQRVFDEIARAKPKTLLVVADGAREERPGDPQLVAATRAIIDRVDWPCDVLKNYSDVNLGCKQRISSGLDWAFDAVEQAIVLEDDCVPAPTFFSYCRVLLDRYRDDDRIVAVSGNNFQTGRTWTPYSYFFSRYFHCWGWASWRRAWRHFDLKMPTWPAFQDNRGLQLVTESQDEENYWQNIFDREHRGLINSWAYACLYSFWSQHGLTILPEVNLISNIGYGDGATHTTQCDKSVAGYPTGELRDLVHPPYIVRDKQADAYIFRHWFCGGGAAKTRRGWRSRLEKYARSIGKRLPFRNARRAA